MAIYQIENSVRHALLVLDKWFKLKVAREVVRITQALKQDSPGMTLQNFLFLVIQQVW
jgi:hypothetical protein